MNYPRDSLANTLKDAGCQVFLNTLNKIPEGKDLVLSETILIQLDSICGMQKLRQNAVAKVFKLQEGPVISETRNRVYVIRPSIEEVRLVSNQINTYLNQDDDKLGSINIKFWIIFIPRLIHYCDLALEEEGVYEYVELLECPLGLIPLEYDVYSLEDQAIFKTLFLNKDSTPLNDIVSSILQLQLLAGNIVDVHGQGSYAKKVADKLDQANLTFSRPSQDKKASSELIETENHPETKEKPAFTDLYLVDRDADFASVMLSQLNYEGILDESFNLYCNRLEFSPSSNDEKIPPKKHSLSNDKDPIFRYIRDNHFSTVFSLVKTKNREMQEKYYRSHDMNLTNLKNFVAHELKRLQAEFKSLEIHISACEEIMKQRNKYDFGEQLRVEQNIMDGLDIKKCLDYIAKMVAHQLNPYVPLRLLALLSLTQGGLPPKDYRKYHSLYCENYGLYNNTTFINLKKLGLITEMKLSLNALTGGYLGYNSSETTNSKTNNPSSLSLATFTGAMSSLTERAGGRVAAVVSSSVLPRRGNLSVMLKKFQLVPEIGNAGYNIRDPKDPGFVFGGTYIPLISQLIDNCVLEANKKNSTLNLSQVELMKLLPGPNFKRKQIFCDETITNGPKSVDSCTKSILVYFIGGVTFAEITALRFVAKKRNVKIAIAATSIINGNKLIDSIFPPEWGQSHKI